MAGAYASGHHQSGFGLTCAPCAIGPIFGDIFTTRKFDHKKQSKSAEEFLLFAPTALSPRDAFGTTSIGPEFVDFEEL